MSYLRRLLCLLFGHEFDPGINHEMSIYLHCARCGELVPGGRLCRRTRR